MKIGNPTLLAVVSALGTGKIDHIDRLEIGLRGGGTFSVKSATVDEGRTMIVGVTATGEAFMVIAEELISLRIQWNSMKPAAVTDIPSAIKWERER